MKRFLSVIILMVFSTISFGLTCEIDEDISFQEIEECDFETVVVKRLVEFVEIADDPDVPIDVLIASYNDLSRDYLTLLKAACKYYDDEPVCSQLPLALEFNDIAMINFP